jgi:hypothetical protein
MAAVATCPVASRRIHAVHVPRATAAISSHRRHPWLSPTLAARGIQSPVHLPAAGGEGEGEEEEELGGARSSTARREAGATREEEPDPREPRTPATSASSTSSPPRRSASPTSAASLLVTAPRTPSPTRAHRPEATQVDAASPPLWTPRPSSRGGTPPHRRAAASEASHRARLGCHFLQEPLPSSTRARSLVYLLLVAVACRAVPLVTATPRHGRVRARARDRAGPTPLRPGAPQHTRTPIWGQGRAFNPVRLRLSSPPSSRVPASPRPCRGRASLARGRQGEGHRFLDRHGRPLPDRTTHARTLVSRPRTPCSPPPMAPSRAPPCTTATPRRDPNPALRQE